MLPNKEWTVPEMFELFRDFIRKQMLEETTSREAGEKLHNGLADLRRTLIIGRWLDIRFAVGPTQGCIRMKAYDDGSGFIQTLDHYSKEWKPKEILREEWDSWDDLIERYGGPFPL